MNLKVDANLKNSFLQEDNDLFDLKNELKDQS